MPLEAPEQVQKCLDEWREARIRGWGEGWLELPSRIAADLAEIIGARPHEVFVGDSTSVNFFKLAAALLAEAPGPVLTTAGNFPSDLYLLQGLGAEIEKVGDAEAAWVPTEELIAALPGKALLTLSHVEFRSGMLHPMGLLSAACRSTATRQLWDLSHSVGAVPMSLHDDGVDAAVGCTYKYLNGGPGSPAFLYLHEKWHDRLRSPIQGWFGQRDPFAFDPDYRPKPGIERWAAGTPPIVALAAASAGIELVRAAGMSAIRGKSVDLTEWALARYHEDLEPLGFRLNTPSEAERRGSHLALGHPEAWRINRTLIERCSVLPDFRRPDHLRLGFSPLTTSFEQVTRGMEAIRRVTAERLYEGFSPDVPTSVT